MIDAIESFSRVRTKEEIAQCLGGRVLFGPETPAISMRSTI
ncbi:hypothetical protein [Cupriavidus necator]